MARRRETVRYQVLIDDLLAGRSYGVFVDDSGSPGLATGQTDLHADRKTWVAVILRPDRAADIVEQLPGILREFHRLTGGREFHAAEVYRGKGPFAHMTVEERLGVFRFLAFMFANEQFPILVQTFDPDQVAALHTRATFPDRFGPFDLRKHVDLGLLWLLMRAKWFLEKDRVNPDLRACVFVDEGYKRNGVVICVPQWCGVFKEGLVCFARSDSVLPLQLADFAAFALNRSQILLAKQGLSPLDLELLRIIGPLGPLFQDIPVGMVEVAELMGHKPKH